MSQENRLREAVIDVIKQNKSMGYSPNRFIAITENGRASEIVQICVSLVSSPDTLEEVEKAKRQYPNLRTLEDEIAESPDGFGLPLSAIEQANARVEYFNKIRNGSV